MDEFILREHLVVIVKMYFETMENVLRRPDVDMWIGAEIQTTVFLTTQLSTSIAAMMKAEGHVMTEKMLATCRLRHVAKMLLLHRPPTISEWGPHQQSSLEAIHSGRFGILHGDPEPGVNQVHTWIHRRIGWTTLLAAMSWKVKECFPAQDVCVVTRTHLSLLIRGSSVVERLGTYKALSTFLGQSFGTVPIILLDSPLSEFYPKDTTTEEFHIDRQRFDALKIILVY